MQLLLLMWLLRCPVLLMHPHTHHTTPKQVAREMLLSFFDRFSATFAAWQPDPTAILAARAAAGAAAAAADAGSGAGRAPRAQLQLVTGCSGGHPRALLAAAVECLERTPKAFASAAAESAAAPLRPAAEEEVEVAAVPGASSVGGGGQHAALLQAGSLPLLRALRLLVLSQHNRVVLAELGLLGALSDLVRQLAQKLQAAAGVLAVRSSSPTRNPSRAGSRSSSPDRAAWAASGQVRLLAPLLAMLQEALGVVQAFAEQEAAHQRQQAVLSSQGGSRAVSHAAQAASQAAVTAGASAAAAALTAATVAPLLGRGMPARCCELLPVLLRVRLHATGASGSAMQLPALERGQVLSGAAALELQALHTLLALLLASPAAASAALQQQGGAPLELLVQLVGWPLAADQLPLSTAALSSSSNLTRAATAAAEAEAASAVAAEGSELEQATPLTTGGTYVRVCSGGGLRSAPQELQLQVLALRVLGVAARSGGSTGLRLLQQQGLFRRLTQLLQWTALTADAPPSATEAAGSVPSPSSSCSSDGTQLIRLFGELWGWLGGSRSSGAAVAQLPLLLRAQLDAFEPAAEAAAQQQEEAAGGHAQQQKQQREFHEAAVAALRRTIAGSSTAGASTVCGCALQQQVLLFAARLLGRHQRLLPLLPPAAGQLAGAAAGGDGGGLSSTQALGNLQALRAAGEGAAWLEWGL